MCRNDIGLNGDSSVAISGRRNFIKVMTAACALATAGEWASPSSAAADGAYSSLESLQHSMNVERIARFTPLGYQSKEALSNTAAKWVQVDLGRSYRIDAVKLFPALRFGFNARYFPHRFRIEAADDVGFHHPCMLVDHTGADYPPPGDRIITFHIRGVKGRYVRLTATLLSQRHLALSKLEVWSGGHDVARNCRVIDSDALEIYNAAAGGDITPAVPAHGHGADQLQYEVMRAIYPAMPAYPTGWPDGKYYGTWPIPGIVMPLTRRPRPQGEGVVTDNPGNVIPRHCWRPVNAPAWPPARRTVTIGGGVLKTAMENNIGYLLNSFTVPELLWPFRTRAGKPNPPGTPPPCPWDAGLPGSNAGRFLMGAGNTLRWMEHPELRRRLNAVVHGIAQCQRSDGYAMGYPEDTIFEGERAAYTRSWVTHGLVDAGNAGNAEAFQVLRRFYDWFDECPWLPQLLRRAGQGVQGMIANTRTYFTPIGKPEDIQVIQRYFQENYWLDGLAKRDPAAIWQYPYDHPHCYLLTSITPYLDLYRATGEKKYLDAVLGGWELFHTQWQHIGGAISICEEFSYPPKTAFLNLRNGENCGSSFWISLNHGLHQLFPAEEKYAAEIEKSVYNVLLANQDGSAGIRYHTNLNGRKEIGTAQDTCCEGQGTRQFGSLPEYIYSQAADGLYVNLYVNSTVIHRQADRSFKLTMASEFPFNPDISIRLQMSRPMPCHLRIRVPQWAAVKVPISINGKIAALGVPGTYQSLDRTWSDGDRITFTLPMAPRLSLYTGVDQTPLGLRYALEYGPILLAVVSTNLAADVGQPAAPATSTQRLEALNIPLPRAWAHDEVAWPVILPITADEITQRLRSVSGKPLHFTIDGVPQYTYVPYFQIDQELFTCFPVCKTPAAYPAEKVGANDLALASRGAVATSDSEWAAEPNCTEKVIDGIIATPADYAANRWHSADTPHPHWVCRKLPQMEEIGRVVIDFADPLGHPTSFQGVVQVDGRDHVVFDVTRYQGWRKYAANITPVKTDTFKLIIRDSASPLHPNAAQISQIELYPPGV